VIFALLGLVVGFVGGARLGYVVGTGGPAAARGALGTGGIDNRAGGNGAGNGDSARASATASTVYTLRSQLALYRLQHNDNYPTLEQLEDNWRVIVGRTDVQGRPAGDRQAGMVFGPYMQSLPVNPLNGKTGVCLMSAAHAEAGWAYDAESGQIKAISPYGSAGNTMSSDLVVHVPR
jgi:hypothetical protein